MNSYNKIFGLSEQNKSAAKVNTLTLESFREANAHKLELLA